MEFVFKSETDYKKFVDFLASDEVERVSFPEKHKKVLNTNRKIYYLTNASIKQIAKKIAKTDPEGFLEYVKNESFEEVLIWGLVITSLDSLGEQIERLDKWKEVVDCWALVDCLDTKKLKGSLDKDKYFGYFEELCYSEKEFVARLGIIMLMYNYLEDAYINKIYEICENVRCKEYYASMAVAWLISVGFVKHRDKTIDLFERGRLDKFTTNKAISKCRDSFRVSQQDKELLLKFRKK